jgi:hypothetical protein
VRIQAKEIVVGLFGGASGSGNGGMLGSLFSGIFGGGKAIGGPVNSNTPYLVGEKGPEIFMPRNAGTIIPNNALGSGSTTNVTYHINAVDAPSFRTMLAREPELIYAITQKGASSIPSGR